MNLLFSKYFDFLLGQVNPFLGELSGSVLRILALPVLHHFDSLTVAGLLQAVTSDHVQLTDLVLVHGQWHTDTVLPCQDHNIAIGMKTFSNVYYLYNAETSRLLWDNGQKEKTKPNQLYCGFLYNKITRTGKGKQKKSMTTIEIRLNKSTRSYLTTM